MPIPTASIPGANLLNADYSKTLYVGLTLENKEDHDVLFGLQGKDKNGKSIFLYPDGRSHCARL